MVAKSQQNGGDITTKWWRHQNKMEDMELVKRITYWNQIGLMTEGRQKKKCREEVIV
jgi:hypothetical protein